MGSLKDAIQKAQLPERTVTLCMNAPLLEELAEAESLARTAETASEARKGETMANRREVRKYREAADALKARVDEESLTLRFRALPSHRYNALLLAHPPRKDNKGDEANGYNTLDFTVGLIRECMVEQIDDATWQEFLDVINDATFDLLAATVHILNRRQDASLPF